MTKDARVIRKLVRAAKNVMKECASRTDGITWSHGKAWDELTKAIHMAEPRPRKAKAK